MRRLFLTVFLAIGIATKLLGQDTLYYDSQYSYTQEFVDSLIDNFLLRDHHHKAFGHILRSHNLDGWQWFHLGQGRTYYYEDKLDSARIALENGLSYIDGTREAMPESDYVCRIRTNVALGNVLQELKFHRQAIQVFQQALSDTEFFPYKWHSYITSGIATNHSLIGNDSIALALTLEISKDTVYMGVPQAGVFNSLILGALYDAKGDLNAAKAYWKKGLLASDNMNYHGYDQTLHSNLSKVYREQDSLKLMVQHLRQAITAQAEFKQAERLFSEAYTKNDKGVLSIYDGDIDNGIQILHEVIDTVKVYGLSNKQDMDLVGRSYSVLSYAYQKLGNFSKAINMLEEKNEMLESFGEFQIKEQLQKLEIEYQAKEKDRSISKLTHQTVEQSATISKQRLQVFSSIILAGLLGLIGFLVYRQRGLKAKYKETSLQQRLLRTQMDPHFVYNSLNSVSSLIYQKSDMAIPYISKLASLLRLILENSRQELVPLEDEIAALDNYLSLESNFGNSFKYTIDTADIETDSVLAPPMLIQPFVENAIKHGFKGIEHPEIHLSVSSNSNLKVLEISILDNGIGLSNAQPNKKHRSVSTSIVEERLAIFGQQYDVDTNLEISERTRQSGTKVNMTIPYIPNE